MGLKPLLKVRLDFGSWSAEAELLDTPVARAFYEHLPCEVELTGWGDEVYGPIGRDLGEHDPIPAIPPGGLAYTNKGNYLCIFFGQTPAWPVEHIGAIIGDWSQLRAGGINSVKITAEE